MEQLVIGSTTENLDTKLQMLDTCQKCEKMLKRSKSRGFESPTFSYSDSDCRGRQSSPKLLQSSTYFLEFISVIKNSAKRQLSSFLLSPVIYTFILVLIIIPSTSSAEAELLQRQYHSCAIASPSNPDSQSNQPSRPARRFHLSSLSSCNVECKTGKNREFCASDGKTYSSKCEIRKVIKCKHKQISIVSKGPCDKPQEENVERQSSPSNCHQEVRNIAHSGSDDVYRPSCHENGTYRAVQCFHGYCWCVQSDGTPIPRTSKKDGEPNCSRGAVNSRKCTRSDRTQFNYRLVKLFATDYSRLNHGESDGESANEDKPSVIEWKYKELDKNHDGFLNGLEVKTLNRLVRKSVKPKKCAKRFPNYCDENKDDSISEAEWSTCLDDNSRPEIERGNTRRPGVSGGNQSSPRHSSNPTHGRETQSAMSFLALLGAKNGIPINSGEAETSTTAADCNVNIHDTEPISSTDCFEERALAEENDRNHPNGQIFVPECVDGGLYRKEQCHKYTGYCWCVDETTGMPIPGYSTHNETPDCTNAKPERIMKGCPYPQKKAFLTQVLDVLSSEMVAFAEQNPDDMSKIPMDPDQRLEERAVRWKFAMLDENSNDELSRKETKDIKDMFTDTASGQPNLRKCARNYLRFCDENNNTRISTEEWVSCLKLIEPAADSTREGRKGTNPLTQFLKG